MPTLKTTDLASILADMASYIQQYGEDTDMYQGYFEEVVRTGLFHDAIGKVTCIVDKSTIEITTDY